MTKHTPGPWGWGFTTRNTGTGALEGSLQLLTQMVNPPCNDPVVLTVRDDWKGYLTRQGTVGEADARLIAAAPELLTGLREALVWLSQLHIGDPTRLEALQKWGAQQAELINRIDECRSLRIVSRLNNAMKERDSQ